MIGINPQQWQQLRSAQMMQPNLQPGIDQFGAQSMKTLAGAGPSASAIGGVPSWANLLMALGGSALQPTEQPQQPMAPAFRSQFQTFDPSQFLRQARPTPPVRGLLGS